MPDKSEFCLECRSNISALSAQSGFEEDVSLGDIKTVAGGKGRGEEMKGRS
jgi:hypothetical protein